MSVTCARPWLEFDLGEKLTVLSWAVANAGFVQARRILWREVTSDDLTPDLDVDAWLASELAAKDASDAVTFLTSRDVTAYTQAQARAGEASAQAVATVGLSNAERIGRREDYTGRDWGTINIAVKLNTALTQVAMIEAMSIAAQARTAAIMDRGFAMPSGHIATGTGTDCIALVSPGGEVRYAGLHTETGEALGRAVYDAVAKGAAEWTPK